MNSKDVVRMIQERADSVADNIFRLPDAEAEGLADWVGVVRRWQEAWDVSDDAALLLALLTGYVLGQDGDPRLLRVEDSATLED